MTYTTTLIFQTTRPGSRSSVPRWNPSGRQDKGEPGRRRGPRTWSSRIVLPRAKTGTPWFPVESKASPLLVILHYLLKNNTQFIGGNGAGQVVPPVSYNHLRLRGGN